jgi:hypothetical protein
VRVEFATEHSAARHAIITITTPQPVTAAGTLANGTKLVLPDNCTGTRMSSVVTTPVKCRVEHDENQTEDLNSNAKGNHDEDQDEDSAARIPIEFQSPSTCAGLSSSTPPCSLSFTASLSSSESYEARKSNQSATANVQLFASSSPQHPQPAVGDCVQLSNRLTTLSTLSASLPQTAQTTFGPAASGTGDPCTPAAVGAVNFPHGKPATFVLGQVWFVELDKLDPNVNSGLATATLQLSNFSSEGSHDQ